MRKFTCVTLTLLLTSYFAFSQSPTRTVGYFQRTAVQRKIPQEAVKPPQEAVPRATFVQLHPPASKSVSACSPDIIATATNAFSFLNHEGNFLTASDALGIIGVIHRQDVTVWGGGTGANGLLRYGVSTDNGTTWFKDIGPLNPVYNYPARYPEMTMCLDDSVPRFAWIAATLNAVPTFDGLVHGVCDIQTSGTPSGTENYSYTGTHSYITNGLCRGKPGEYWTVTNEYDGTSVSPTLHLYKGIYDGALNDVIWARVDTFNLPFSLSFDGQPHFVPPTISFSPDGMDGYIALLGDITGGNDSVYSPILLPTHDGGATWGAPIEVDMRTFGWFSDSLTAWWQDSLGGPAGSGRATCAFECDLVVDMNGNPHVGVVIGNASTPSDPAPGYTIYSGIEKFVADIYSTDHGATWTSRFMAPVLTFRAEWGGASGTNPIPMDNHIQAARSEDGNYIFFAWADSDTNLIGYGVSDNLAPNLVTAGWRVSDGYQTCYKMICLGDIQFDGTVLYPNMAPVTIRRGSAHHLFAGFLRFQIPNDESQPTDWFSLLDDTYWDEADFYDPSFYTDMSWPGDAYCGIVSREEPTHHTGAFVIHEVYPNPAVQSAGVSYELPFAADVRAEVYDASGKKSGTMHIGRMNAGRHTLEVNCGELPAGMYIIRLIAGEEMQSRRFTVLK